MKDVKDNGVHLHNRMMKCTERRDKDQINSEEEKKKPLKEKTGLT